MVIPPLTSGAEPAIIRKVNANGKLDKLATPGTDIKIAEAISVADGILKFKLVI